MSMPRAYVHLAYGIAAAQYRERFLAGEVPDETPYGFHHAECMGWHVSFSEDQPESGLGRRLRKGLIRLLGFDVIHAWRNRERMREADVVWTMEEVEYLAVCALPAVCSMPRRRVIAQTIWLFNRWQTYSFVRRDLLRRLLKRADVLTFHSAQYLDLLPKLVAGLTAHLLPFGISLDSFPWTEPRVTGGEGRALRVLSMGSDPTRDWSTLLAAFGNDPRFELQVISPRLTDAAIAIYSNVKCPRRPTMGLFRELYEWADLVVVPMVPNLYSGITVALEAVSMGVPVISSRTGGVPTYFSDDEVLYVPPQDGDALRRAALDQSPEQRLNRTQKAQARFLREDYSSRGMAARYVSLSLELLSQ